MSNRYNAEALRRFDAPLDVDGIPEFHAARLVLLLRLCGDGTRGSIKGRTKLAKLDFFLRYPRFLEVALARLRTEGREVPSFRAGVEGVEANMIRYRFGPWDHRYYDLLALLQGRGLITISGRVETYTLTRAGGALADRLQQESSFAPVVDRCGVIAQAFAGFSGTDLKRFVYATFQEGVAALPSGTTIDEPGSTDKEV